LTSPNVRMYRENRERLGAAGDERIGGEAIERQQQATRQDRAGRVLNVSCRILVPQLTVAVHQLAHVTTQLRQAGVPTPRNTDARHARCVQFCGLLFTLMEISNDIIMRYLNLNLTLALTYR